MLCADELCAVQKMLDSVPMQHLPDLCTSLVKASYAEKLEVLDAVDITERFNKTLPSSSDTLRWGHHPLHRYHT